MPHPRCSPPKPEQTLFSLPAGSIVQIELSDLACAVCRRESGSSLLTVVATDVFETIGSSALRRWNCLSKLACDCCGNAIHLMNGPVPPGPCN
jgi:hypothetical protein